MRLVEAVKNPEAIRALLCGIVLTRGPNRGEVHVSLRGELMAILDLANGSVVHGARGGDGANTECSDIIINSVAPPRSLI